MPFERHVFLNYMFARSKTMAPREHTPPMHGARELFHLLGQRFANGNAIVFLSAEESEDPDETKASQEKSSAVRFRRFGWYENDHHNYLALLVEHIDHLEKTFPVVHRQSFVGRDLQADAEERGSATAHVVVRIPKQGDYDVGEYRTAIEVVHGTSRRIIETLINRLLREMSADWTFSVEMKDPRGRRIQKIYKYRPRLELNADIGRSLLGGPRNSTLTHMVFTKRSEKLNTGQETEVEQIDVIGDIEYNISASQAPEDAEERKGWLTKVREKYESLGFKSKLYFRHNAGFTLRAGVRHDESSAADMLLCPKEIVSIDDIERRWRDDMSVATLKALFALLDRDDLWRSGT